MNESQQDNPFASPLSRETVLAKDEPVTLAQRRPWSMLLIGVLLGSAFGATAGGVTSGTIGFAAIVVDGAEILRPPGDDEIGTRIRPIAVVVFGAIFGAMQGGWMGAVIGGIAGLISGLRTPLRRAEPKWKSAVLAAIGGGTFGVIAGQLVIGGTVAMVACAALAAAVGFVTGALLGRTIAAIAIRQRQTVTPPAA
jgi:hypothetical protein